MHITPTTCTTGLCVSDYSDREFQVFSQPDSTENVKLFETVDKRQSKENELRSQNSISRFYLFLCVKQVLIPVRRPFTSKKLDLSPSYHTYKTWLKASNLKFTRIVGEQVFLDESIT
uniref:Uncharacterized protein n=1 Tax=Glossina austeni TaxID=7395 RepID=A0A1A9V2H6_GLOAU